MLKQLQEVDGQLINHWYIFSLSKELKQKPMQRKVYDVQYVAFRDNSGQVKVFIDKCIHRGSTLSHGKCENGQLRCPYHGWVYGPDGKVVEIPSEGPINAKSDEQKMQRHWKLQTVPCVERDGVIWIWPGDAAIATTTPSWDFPEFGNKKYAQYFMITDFENEVTHLVQNFMDVPHTVFVHDKWFRKRRMIKVPIQLAVQNGQVKVTYNQENDKIGFTEKILNYKGHPMLHTDEYIFPNISCVNYYFGDYRFIINSQCTPISRYQTRVYTWIAYNIGPLSFFLKPFMQFYTRKVITQDVDIMKIQGNNLKHMEELGNSVAMTKENGYQSTEADELHLAIDKMRLQGVQDRQLPYKASYTREREFWI